MLELWRVENEELVSSGLRQDCYGADLVDAGWQAWDNVMPEALANHDDDWLVDQMLDPSFWRSHRPRKLKSGGYSQSRVSPSWASKLLCLGEFNIAYVRGLSEVLLSRGEKECVSIALMRLRNLAVSALRGRSNGSPWRTLSTATARATGHQTPSIPMLSQFLPVSTVTTASGTLVPNP